MARQRVTDREAIVTAAAKLFEERGYRNTTIEDIAHYLGIAKPTVYAHVESKAAVLEAIFERLLGRLRGGLHEIAQNDPDPLDEARAMIRFLVEAAGDLRPYFLIFFGDERELEARTRKRFRGWAREVTELVEGVIQRGIDAGEFPKELDPKIAAYLIIGMVTSVIRWYDPKGLKSSDEISSQIYTLLRGFEGEAAPVRAAARG
ncbi:MAG: TetR/AcrR family transcriptional regulator [Actinomycetota bacterium]